MPDQTFVALLRAVNVGGRGTVPMAELRALAGELGLDAPRTHLQSGNLVVRTTSSRGRALAPDLERAVEARFGFPVAVLVRTPDELAAIAARHPHLDDEADRANLHVAFLAARPPAKAVAALDHERFAPDTVVVDGREAYLHYPGGAGRSKLTTAALERTLGTTATARNLRTVEALLQLAQG